MCNILRIISIALTLLGLNGTAPGQGISHVYQNSFIGGYTSVSHGTSGDWYAAGVSYHPPWFYTSFLRRFSPDGEVMGEWPLVVPGNEVTAVTNLISRDDNSLVLSGYVTPGCDFGTQRGLACLFFDGDVQWLRTYSTGPLYHSAQNDSLLAFVIYHGLLFTDHGGDSLYMSEFPSGHVPRRVSRTDQGFVSMGSFGAHEILPDGTISSSLTGVNVLDMIQSAGGQLYALTPDSVLELTGGLQRTGNASPVTGLGPRRIGYAGGLLRVHTVDTIFSFASDLSQLSAMPIEQPWVPGQLPSAILGYQVSDVEFAGSEVMTAGAYRSGISMSACRSIMLDTVNSSVENDLNLSNLTISSFSYTVSSWTLSGSATVRTWLHNHGNEPIQKASLSYVRQYICGLDGRSQAYDTLSLAPGDSIQLELGPFLIFEFVGQSDTVEICIWGSRPNDMLDRDPTNNKVCTRVVVDVTTEVSDLLATEGPTIFPNPTSGRVVLRPGLQDHGPFELNILDMQGRPVLKRSMNYAGVAISLDINALGAGVYFVEFMRPGYRTSHRLVVN